MNGGLGIPMGGGEILQYLRNPNKIAELLTQQHDATGDSPAEIFADIVNIMRADTRVIGRKVGAEIEIERMTPDRAAELLAGTLDGDGVELVEMFNQEAERRDRILQAAMDDEEYERFLAQKQAAMYTSPDTDAEWSDEG